MSPQTPVMPVVKADGYGHGARRVVHALQDAVPGFAVAAMAEAVALRRAGLTARLCVLSGPQDPSDWDLCVQLDLDVVIHAAWQWEQLRQRDRTPRFWLKFDTGMGRLGFLPDLASSLAIQLHGHPHRAACLGVFTHLACADEPGSTHTRHQLRVFDALCAQHFSGLPVSIANSAGLCYWPDARRGLLRPGLVLYGVLPGEQAVPALADLRPALRFEARVLDVKTLPPGHGVGYGSTWITAKPTRLALVGAGYADGVFRGMDERGFHLTAADGQALPVRGRVSMDMLAVEVPADSTLAPGDWVGIWGAGAMPVEAAARCARTLAYELLTALGERVEHQDVSALR